MNKLVYECMSKSWKTERLNRVLVCIPSNVQRGAVKTCGLIWAFKIEKQNFARIPFTWLILKFETWPQANFLKLVYLHKQTRLSQPKCRFLFDQWLNQSWNIGFHTKVLNETTCLDRKNYLEKFSIARTENKDSKYQEKVTNKTNFYCWIKLSGFMTPKKLIQCHKQKLNCEVLTSPWSSMGKYENFDHLIEVKID